MAQFLFDDFNTPSANLNGRVPSVGSGAWNSFTDPVNVVSGGYAKSDPITYTFSANYYTATSGGDADSEYVTAECVIRTPDVDRATAYPTFDIALTFAGTYPNYTYVVVRFDNDDGVSDLFDSAYLRVFLTQGVSATQAVYVTLPSPLLPLTEYTIKLAVGPNDQKVYVDGVEVIAATVDLTAAPNHGNFRGFSVESNNFDHAHGGSSNWAEAWINSADVSTFVAPGPPPPPPEFWTSFVGSREVP